MKFITLLFVGAAMLTFSACATCLMSAKKKSCCAADGTCSDPSPTKECCKSGHAGHSHGKAKKTN